MLKTKNIFIIFFSLLVLVFAFIFYILANSHLNLLLLKQYEQKIKSLDDTLRFGLLEQLNPQNIKEFATYTRADFIIKKNGELFSSLDETFENFEKKALLSDKKFLTKEFNFKDYNYTIIVYPYFTDFKKFWSKMLLFFGFYLILVLILFYFIGKKLAKHLQQILEFLQNIDTQRNIFLENSIFKELNLLNKKLFKTKDKILKKNEKAKKQSDKISLKNTQLTSVISAISHELKNPLSVIDLSLLILRDENLKDEKLKKELLEKIMRQSLKLNKLTEKLNFVFNFNTQNLKMQDFDLFELCRKIIENPGFERVILQGKSSKVKADEFLIEQVIINLLSNALKYSQKEVILSVENSRLCVQDFGIGIEENQLKLVTKKFYKIDSKSDNSFGLGLFLVKKILSIHKSYLEIFSKPNQGSQFSFKL